MCLTYVMCVWIYRNVEVFMEPLLHFEPFKLVKFSLVIFWRSQHLSRILLGFYSRATTKPFRPFPSQLFDSYGFTENGRFDNGTKEEDDSEWSKESCMFWSSGWSVYGVCFLLLPQVSTVCLRWNQVERHVQLICMRNLTLYLQSTSNSGTHFHWNRRLRECCNIIYVHIALTQYHNWSIKEELV